MANTLDKTINTRGKRYGTFAKQSVISQSLKQVMQASSGWEKLACDQAEALDMIQNKVARILNGDPNYADSWHDIAGYAQLVFDRLNGMER